MHWCEYEWNFTSGRTELCEMLAGCKIAGKWYCELHADLTERMLKAESEPDEYGYASCGKVE